MISISCAATTHCIHTHTCTHAEVILCASHPSLKQEAPSERKSLVIQTPGACVPFGSFWNRDSVPALQTLHFFAAGCVYFLALKTQTYWDCLECSQIIDYSLGSVRHHAAVYFKWIFTSNDAFVIPLSSTLWLAMCLWMVFSSHCCSTSTAGKRRLCTWPFKIPFLRQSYKTVQLLAF